MLSSLSISRINNRNNHKSFNCSFRENGRDQQCESKWSGHETQPSHHGKALLKQMDWLPIQHHYLYQFVSLTLKLTVYILLELVFITHL